MSSDPCRPGLPTPTLLTVAQLQEVAKGRDPVFLVTLKEAGGPRGPASPSGEEELSPEWDKLVGDFADVFPEEHPGLPPDRAVQLEINLEPGTQPVSNPAYRLSPA
jgi:hypothetical protein